MTFCISVQLTFFGLQTKKQTFSFNFPNNQKSKKISFGTLKIWLLLIALIFVVTPFQNVSLKYPA